jgi:hypothetical protein
MTDEQLRAKFIDQSTPVIGADKAERAWTVSMAIGREASLAALLAAAT